MYKFFIVSIIIELSCSQCLHAYRYVIYNAFIGTYAINVLLEQILLKFSV